MLLGQGGNIKYNRQLTILGNKCKLKDYYSRKLLKSLNVSSSLRKQTLSQSKNGENIV